MVVIRQGTPEDAAALFDYRASLRSESLPTLLRHDRIYSVSDEANFLRKFEENENWTFLVACDGTSVIGHLELAGGLHSQTRHVARLGMSVLRSFRGRGLGTSLFAKAKSWARGAGILRIELEVFESNQDAIRLYERLGFEKDGLRRDAVRSDSEFLNLVVMSIAVRENTE